MKATFVLAGVLLVAGLVWFGVVPRAASNLLIEDVVAMPMGTSGVGVFLTVNNLGAPDRLTKVSSSIADVSLYDPQERKKMAIQSGRSSFAMDAAHIRMAPVNPPLEEGSLVPLTLTFESAGDIAIKARISGPINQTHADMSGMDSKTIMDMGESAPRIAIATSPEGDGWRVKIAVENFVFSKDQMGQPHAPGIGHAHIYVGGMKLGRVFGTDYLVGQLPPGRHDVRVTLNTNDHQAYMLADGPVTAVAVIVVD